MKNYSIATANSVARVPDSIYAVSVDESCEDCDSRINKDHFVLMWSGNGYTKRNSWISAPQSEVHSLEEMR